VDGKICLVTGGTFGIGKATAAGLVKLGAKVVIVGRNSQRGKMALTEIKAQSGKGEIEFIAVDLSSQITLRQFASAFNEKYPRLDVLVNNAGGLFFKRQLSQDGIEMTLALNTLAPFLLTHLLLDQLKASTPARVVNVSSEAQRAGSLDFSNLQGEKRYLNFQAYGRCKLALTTLSYEMARRLEGTGVTVNALHPGGVATGFGQGDSRLLMALFKLAKPFLLTPEQGAETSLYLASSPQLEGVTGKYFIKKAEATSPAQSYDRAVTQRLWKLCEELTHLPA